MYLFTLVPETIGKNLEKYSLNMNENKILQSSTRGRSDYVFHSGAA